MNKPPAAGGRGFVIDNGQLTIIMASDVPVFAIRRLKNPPISETVGNGLCAVPGNVAKTTCVGKQNHPPVCHSDRSVSGVEESTTLVKEPTQDKTCYSGRFLHSISFRSE